jgi:hypothetical protein
MTAGSDKAIGVTKVINVCVPEIWGSTFPKVETLSKRVSQRMARRFTSALANISLEF